MKPVDFIPTTCPSSQCLIDQIQVKKPVLVVAPDQMPDCTLVVSSAILKEGHSCIVGKSVGPRIEP